jgi:bifunctional UDP-N-acetylglucosamine pyrophosphorylase/glucosamine-1-phosphate N-acetyltransferase
MQTTEIIILAAGKGTRMESDKPKCLVPVKGIPMIERLISNIQKSLTNRPLVVVGHKAEEVERYLGDTVRYVHQVEQKGTAHAAQAALKALLPTTQNVIILYADHPFVSAQTINSLISKLSSTTVAIATTDAGDFSGWKSLFSHWGRIVYSETGMIERITEYKDADETTKAVSKVNPGFYAFKVEWLVQALAKVKPANAQGEYYLTDVIKMAREELYDIGEVAIEPFEAMGLNSKKEIEYAESLI